MSISPLRFATLLLVLSLWVPCALGQLIVLPPPGSNGAPGPAVPTAPDAPADSLVQTPSDRTLRPQTAAPAPNAASAPLPSGESALLLRARLPVPYTSLHDLLLALPSALRIQPAPPDASLLAAQPPEPDSP